MPLKDFVSNFSACFHHTSADRINSDTEYKKLEEWSSILVLIIIAMVDTDYDKVLTADDIKNATTVSDLYTMIQSK